MSHHDQSYGAGSRPTYSGEELLTMVEVPVNIGGDARQHVGWLRIKRNSLIDGLVIYPTMRDDDGLPKLAEASIEGDPNDRAHFYVLMDLLHGNPRQATADPRWKLIEAWAQRRLSQKLP
jgi:hypothetical protein